MSATIKFEPKAQDELNKLPLDITDRIVEKLHKAQENLEHFLERLEGMPEYKIRVGDYRVILLWDKPLSLLKIQAVGHRKNIYKRYKTS